MPGPTTSTRFEEAASSTCEAEAPDASCGLAAGAGRGRRFDALPRTTGMRLVPQPAVMVQE